MLTGVVLEAQERRRKFSGKRLAAVAGFGFEYVEAALRAQGRRIAVVDSEEVKDDLVQDMIEVLTSFCARLYGRRSAKNKAKKALEAIQCEN
jgi:putative resolvase